MCLEKTTSGKKLRELEMMINQLTQYLRISSYVKQYSKSDPYLPVKLKLLISLRQYICAYVEVKG